MKRKEFYEEICKLAPSEYDASKCDFPKHLEEKFNDYIDLISKLDVPSQDVLKVSTMIWDEINNEIKDLIKVINETVDLYYRGFHSKAYSNIREKIIHIMDMSLASKHIIYPNAIFYRMRIFKESEKRNPKSMFHIPYNMRTKVSTQRYSSPGYPCLYLGSSAYVCWEEMLRPHLDECYVSKFQTQKSMCLLNLALPYIDFWTDTEKSEESNVCFLHDLLRFPLVIACMVKVANPKDTFKPEYIIPQLLMEWVIAEERPRTKIIGIAYTSVHKSNDFTFPLSKLTNYAIPAFLPAQNNYSKELCRIFKVSKPTCDELERAKCPYLAIERDEKMSDLEYSYRISTFGQLEARLEEFPTIPIENIPKEQEF